MKKINEQHFAHVTKRVLSHLKQNEDLYLLHQWLLTLQIKKKLPLYLDLSLNIMLYEIFFRCFREVEEKFPNYKAVDV